MTLDELISRLKVRVKTDGLPYPPATQEEIEDAEDLLGCELPPVLRRLYTEVGNGGFGPGYGGVLGLGNGSMDDQDNTAVSYDDKWRFPEPFSPEAAEATHRMADSLNLACGFPIPQSGHRHSQIVSGLGYSEKVLELAHNCFSLATQETLAPTNRTHFRYTDRDVTGEWGGQDAPSAAL